MGTSRLAVPEKYGLVRALTRDSVDQHFPTWAVTAVT